MTDKARNNILNQSLKELISMRFAIKPAALYFSGLIGEDPQDIPNNLMPLFPGLIGEDPKNIPNNLMPFISQVL